jgi:hypothetical protein
MSNGDLAHDLEALRDDCRGELVDGDNVADAIDALLALDAFRRVWPGDDLTYGESPVELIYRLRDERDAMKERAAKESGHMPIRCVDCGTFTAETPHYPAQTSKQSELCHGRLEAYDRRKAKVPEERAEATGLSVAVASVVDDLEYVQRERGSLRPMTETILSVLKAALRASPSQDGATLPDPAPLVDALSDLVTVCETVDADGELDSRIGGELIDAARAALTAWKGGSRE